MTVFSAWQDIDSVFLDMDGTLLDLYFDNHFWQEHIPLVYARERSLGEDEARQHLMELYGQARGTLDWYSLDYWSDRLALDIRNIKRDMSHRIATRPNARLFLQRISEVGKRVVMVTNAHPATLEIKLEMTGIDVHFDLILDSHRIGLAKEQAGFWDRLQETEPFDPQRTMFIDDNLEVLRCAAEYGIAHVFAIAEPDSSRGKMEAEPYTAIEDFSTFIEEL